MKTEILTDEDRREAVRWSAKERAAGVGEFEAICDLVDRYDATVESLRSSLAEARRAQEHSQKYLIGLQGTAREIAKEMLDAPTSDENKRGKRLLHEVIVSRAVAPWPDCPTCGKCRPGDLGDYPAFGSIKGFCLCERKPAAAMGGEE